MICKNKRQLDIDEAKSKLSRCLGRNYYYPGCEWPYKYVPHRILAEKYMESDEGGLTDYKIHCFNGGHQFILVCIDRYSESGLKEVFYSLKWEKLSVHRPNMPIQEVEIQKPENLDEMIRMAKDLPANFPFVRVDFYQINRKAYFGEMTFFPASGYKRFVPEEYDLKVGSLLELSLRK